MRIATPGPARSRLLLLATLVLVLGGGTVWLALGTARPLQAPPLPPATARPSATPAPASPPSPTLTVTPLPAATATATPAPQAGRAGSARNLAATPHNNRPGGVFRYLYAADPFAGHAVLWALPSQTAMSHGDVPHVYAP